MTPPTTYSDTIDFLYNQLPAFNRIGAAAYKADLDNIIWLCNFLDNPQNKFKTIHIAGTNGKGSVSHCMAAVLQTAGYKTGLYTSPHLVDFRERIRINGEMVEENFVIDFVKKIFPAFEKIQPSFFEITVTMAFAYFALQKVDVAVVEVGLGGRLDSTNIITPELSVITNISLEHTDLLGDTMEKIAYEKAGIIKQNVPVVIGETQQEILSVFENIAKEKNANFFIADQMLICKEFEWIEDKLFVSIQDADNTTQYQLDLTGIYQTKNILTILASIKVLQEAGWEITQENILEAMKSVKQKTNFLARWQKIQDNPSVYLDAAHNASGVKQLLLQIEKMKYEKLRLILGMVKDKDHDAVFSILPQSAKYYFTQANTPRALDKTNLQVLARQYYLLGDTYKNVSDALDKAKKDSSKDDLIVCFGSIFLISELI